MPRVVVTTYLDAPPDAVWAALQCTAVLRHVSAPLIRFLPLDPPNLPETWSEGEYRVAMRLFGFVPLGTQWIRVSWPAPQGETRYVRDNGTGTLAARWDHLISIAPEGQGTRYTDRVDVEAGVLSPVTAVFARLFYAHRQRRWRTLAARAFVLR
ncbi:MAG: hypothetical protein AAFQ59_09040 [Pseudomonadota bacterium]